MPADNPDNLGLYPLHDPGRGHPGGAGPEGEGRGGGRASVSAMISRPHIRSDFIERRRNTRNVHYTAMISRGTDRGCWYESWMPIEEWTRTVESLPVELPGSIVAKAGEAVSTGVFVTFGADGKLYAAKP